jgi:hypothetical protein
MFYKLWSWRDKFKWKYNEGTRAALRYALKSISDLESEIKELKVKLSNPEISPENRQHWNDVLERRQKWLEFAYKQRDNYISGIIDLADDLRFGDDTLHS